jgi:spore maturation protein CgeB
MSEIYSASRIGFNYLRPGESVTMRCMEIMSCGTMLLVNRPSDGSFEDLGFKDAKDLVFYDSPRQLFSLIAHYLNNEDQRQRIARAGHELVLARHTYRHRLQEMLACL